MEVNVSKEHVLEEAISTVEETEAKCEQQWCAVATVIFLAAVFVSGVVGNTIVLRVMFSVRSKSSTDIFVMFLSCSDLLTILSNIPVHLIQEFKQWSTLGSDLGCKIHFFIYVMTFTSSGMFFAFIGLDRYLKIFHTQKRNLLNRHPITTSYLVLLATSLTAGVRSTLTGNDEHHICQFNVKNSSLSGLHTFINGLVFMFSATVICVAYWRIVLHMRSAVHPVGVSTISAQTKNTRSTLNPRNAKVLSSSRALAFMSLMFLLCTIIPSVLSAIIFASSLYLSRTGGIAAYTLSRMYYINVCINPYIYFRMNSEFRERANDLLLVKMITSLYHSSVK